MDIFYSAHIIFYNGFCLGQTDFAGLVVLHQRAIRCRDCFLSQSVISVSRSIWPRVVSEGKAALAGDALLAQATQQATALMALLTALSAEKQVDSVELSKSLDACGTGLGVHCKELRKLAT